MSVSIEQKAKLLANLIKFRAGTCVYGPTLDGPLERYCFDGCLPADIEPEQVIDFLPKGWRFYRFKRDETNTEPEQLEQIALIPAHREGVCFEAPIN